MKELLRLFLAFARIAVMTFGGGYAMLPMLEREVCERNHWAEHDEIMDYFAIGQCTPGIIAINVATFIGYKRKGILGGIMATLGFIFPSIIIVTLIAALVANFYEIPAVKYAFAGIRVSVCALLVNAIVRFYKSGVKDLFGFIVFAATLAFAIFTKTSPVVYVLLAGTAGVLYIKSRRAKQ